MGTAFLFGVMKVKVLVAQLCPTLCNPMDYSLPGSSVHGLFQVRILEWVAISFSYDRFLSRKCHDLIRLFFLAGSCSFRDISSATRDSHTLGIEKEKP